MARVRTQEDFIEKAKEVHGSKYDYSLVDYVDSSTKVKIICPIHGEFEQTPNKHLAGQGCKQCGRNRTKVGVDEFIQRARAVHGDKYDYSKVQYERKDKKVTIVCPEHGEFQQTPACHVTLRQGCPKCAAIAGGLKRRGDNNPMRQDTVKQKAQNTCMERYGAKTYAESIEGRKKLHDIITSDDVQSRMAATCLERYGAKMWSQSDVGRDQLHLIMSSDEMHERVKQGYLANYGVEHYMKTQEGRDKARANIMLPERRIAIRQAFINKYGVPNALSVPFVQDKIHATNLRLYGSEYIGACAWVHEKSWQTKRRNGTFSTSKPEETLYRLLCDAFGQENVVRQYADPVRYPFRCDFYIKPFDMFIELNASWTHGGHWFDEHNSLDVSTLLSWADHHSRYYDSAIHVWTVRDPMKRQCAIDNGLNYLVFWDNDLTDARRWLSQYMKL